MKNTNYTMAFAVSLAVSGISQGAVIFDDFSADTSADYTGTDSFGSGGSFTVLGGTLNLSAGADNTAAIVSSNSSLGIGESYSIDLLDSPAGNGSSDGPDGQFLMLTTSMSQPNGSSSFGFRLRIDNQSLIRLSTYSNGGNNTITTATAPTVSPDIFWIDRTTATDFEFYYGDAGSRTLITAGSLLLSEVATDLRVGVQAYSAPGGTEEWNFDNLRIQETTNVPEPSSAILLGLAGLAISLRRRR